MNKFKENAKAIATLVGGIAVAFTVNGTSGDAEKWLTIVAVIASSVVTWAVPNAEPVPKPVHEAWAE